MTIALVPFLFSPLLGLGRQPFGTSWSKGPDCDGGVCFVSASTPPIHSLRIWQDDGP